MASYLDKMQMNTAITDNSKFDLSHIHVTTANFMSIAPIMFKPMVPGEKLDVDVETFARLNPLPTPTFGRANIKNRAFFIPYRTVFRGFNDYITDSEHVDSAGNATPGVPVIVPTLRNTDLIEAISNPVYGFLVTASSTDYDYVLYDDTVSPATTTYIKLSQAGRMAMKVLNSLGYVVNWRKSDDRVYSALNLLCWVKAYIDWYWPSAYVNHVGYRRLMAICNYDLSAPYTMSGSDVALALQLTFVVPYDSDYFTAQFDYPNQPGAQNHSDFKLVNIDTASTIYSSGLSNGVERGYVTNNSASASGTTRLGNADAPFISPYVSTSPAGYVVGGVSEYLLHSLHALTDFMKRNQLASSRSMDRFLARFGKALPAEKLNRSVYLGSQIIPISIGDVMSTADTTGASLAQYGGKGIAYGDNGNFSYSTDEYGLFIIVSSIVPAAGYFQGISPFVKHLTKTDMWQPEFDSLGVQACGADELYISNDGTSGLADKSIHQQVFGFLPRYAEYKTAQDQLTGSYRYKTLNASGQFGTGSSSYHLFREFDDSDWSGTVANMVHDFNFVTSTGDLGQYNRIFYNTAPDAPDQINLIHNFTEVSYSPMKSLYDSYEFEDKGKKVTLDVNGVKMN